MAGLKNVYAIDDSMLQIGHYTYVLFALSIFSYRWL